MRKQKSTKGTKIRFLSIFVTMAMLFTLLPGGVTAAYAADNLGGVTFSQPGGFYGSDVSLALSSSDSGAEIHYTLDGTEPTEASPLYGGPITVSDRPDTDRPLTAAWAQGAFVESHYVVKAKAFKGGDTSRTVTNTYFVAPGIGGGSTKTKYGMPVANITFVPGTFIGPSGFYNNWGNEDLVAQGYVEYFDEYGVPSYRHSAEIKIAGHASRDNIQKSLRLNFSKGDIEKGTSAADGLMGYDLFPGTSSNYEKSESTKNHIKMNFRISDTPNTAGVSTYTNLREPLVHSVVAHLRLDVANSESTAVFVNGEFWGIYEFREQYDNNFYAQHYDAVTKSTLVQLSFDHDTANTAYASGTPLYKAEYSEGPSGQDAQWFGNYMQMYNLVTQGDISQSERYTQLKAVLDVDNYIDYIMPYIFFDNDDWPGNNVKMWRTTGTDGGYGADGRWRFSAHDFDIAMYSPTRNTFKQFLTGSLSGDGFMPGVRQPAWATVFMQKLFTNQEFRETFTARFSAYLGTAFDSARTTAILDDLKAKFEPSSNRNWTRWGGNASTWNSNINFARNFLQTRGGTILNYVRSYYNEAFSQNINASPINVTFKTDVSKGWYDIAGAQIRPSDYGNGVASEFTAPFLKGYPIRIKATPLAGRQVKGYEVEYSGSGPITILDPTLTLTPGADETRSVTVTALYENLENLSFSIAGNNVTVPYDGTVKTNSGYTILKPEGFENYTVSGVNITAATGKNVPATPYGQTINLAGLTIRDEDGVDVTDQFAATKWTPGSLTIQPVPLTMTAGSDSKPYDGSPLTNNDVTYSGFVGSEATPANTPTVTGYDVVGSALTVAATNSITLKQDFAIIGKDGEDLTANYTVGTTNGTLGITPNPTMTFTIKGTDVMAAYNGYAQAAGDYKVIASSGVGGYTASGVTVKAAMGKHVDGSPYSQSIDSSGLRILDSQGTDVTALVGDTQFVPGTLVINPIALTLTAGSASKDYDGSPLTNREVDFSGFVGPEATSEASPIVTGYSTTGIATDVTVPNPITLKNFKIYSRSGEDLTSNYTVKTVAGTLAIRKASLAGNDGKVNAAPTTVGKSAVSKLAVGKRQLKITVKKVAVATRYQIQYRLKGTVKWKAKYTAKGKTVLTIKKLKKGKAYQVRVRSVMVASGKTIYSAWSKVKISKKIK